MKTWQELTTSKKPIRLRKVCKDTKSKVLVDVYWSKLSGNKDPYLSVNIAGVRDNGVKVEDYQKKVEFLKGFDKELYTLLKNHLCSYGSFEGIHELANARYHFKLTKQHTLAQPETVEKVKAELETIKNSIYKFNYRQGNITKVVDFVAILDRKVGSRNVQEFLLDLFKDTYTYFEPTTDRKLDYLRKIYSQGAFTSLKQFDQWLSEVKETLKKYHKLNEKFTSYSGARLINDSEIWDVERFSNTYNILELEVKDLFFMSDKEQQEKLNAILAKKVLQSKEFMVNMTDKYNIPVVYS